MLPDLYTFKRISLSSDLGKIQNYKTLLKPSDNQKNR